MKKVTCLVFLLAVINITLGEVFEHEEDSLLSQVESTLENDPSKALDMAGSAVEYYTELDDPKKLARLYFLMGEAAYYLDDLQGAIEHYKMAVRINIAAGLDLTPEHVNLLGNLGYFHDHLDQKVIALDYYEQALQKARELGLKDEIAANLANIGQLKTLQGNYEEAIECMEEALAIDRELGDESIIAVDLNTLGRMYEGWGMYEKAIGYLQEALEIDQRLGLQAQVAIRYNSMGLVYKSWKRYPEALEAFNKALEIDRALGNEDKVALRYSNLGSTYLAMGQPDKAIEFLTTGLRYFTDNDMPSYQASGMVDLGKAYFLKKYYEKSEEVLTKALAITLEEDYKSWRMSSLETLSDVYAASGDHIKALETYKAFIRLKDSVFSIESQKKVAEFQAKYDLYSQQKENELLRKDSELQREQKTIILLVFSAAGLLFATLVLALLMRLRSNRYRQVLAEKENDALKHDLEQKNNELTYNAMCIIKNNETVSRIVDVVEQALDKGSDKVDLKQIVFELQSLERDKGWKEFEIRFTQTHRDFYDKLLGRFPDLTPNERKLCAFLRLNMSSKDIASITHQSVHSINVARTRMRKKLGIGQTDENLVSFLQGL